MEYTAEIYDKDCCLIDMCVTDNTDEPTLLSKYPSATQVVFNEIKQSKDD